jgi:hypothetical protein
MSQRKRTKSSTNVKDEPIAPGSTLYQLLQMIAHEVAKDLVDKSVPTQSQQTRLLHKFERRAPRGGNAPPDEVQESQ